MKVNINNNLAIKIQKARIEQGLTQKELGTKTGYSVPAISQIESGNLHVSVESLYKLAKALQKPINYFLENLRDQSEDDLVGKLIKIERELKVTNSLIKVKLKPSRLKNYSIAVVGNVGLGKLVRFDLMKALGKTLSAQVVHEKESENPYLKLFFKNKSTWAFHSQLFFLKENLKQQSIINNGFKPVIQGRTIYDNFRVFTKLFYSKKYINQIDFQLLNEFFLYAKEIIRKPDLVIYLDSDPKRLWKVLKNNNPPYSKEYVLDLGLIYQEWVGTFDIAPVIKLPALEINPKDPKIIKTVTNKLIERL